MIVHIIRNNENISEIALKYNATVEDIIEANPQVTDYKNIAPGTKIMVPIITSEVEQVLASTEAFIKEYYPIFNEYEIDKKIVLNEDNVTKDKPLEKGQNRGKPYPGIIPTKY